MQNLQENIPKITNNSSVTKEYKSVQKAVFYLRPEVMELPQQVADEEIERYISRFGISSQRRKARKCRLAITLSVLFLFFSGIIIFCLV